MVGPPRDHEPVAPMSEVVALFEVSGEVGRVGIVDGGWSHQVWRVETSTDTVAVKQLRREHEQWWMAQLLAASEFELAAWAAGTVPMAEPLQVENGGGLLGELPTWTQDHLYRCHRWVDATPCINARPSIERSRRAGAMVAALCALRFPTDGTIADLLPWNALDAFDDTIDEARDRSMPWAASLEMLSPRVEQLRAQFSELAILEEPVGFTHRDFDPKNAAEMPHGTLVIFDWDYAGPRMVSSELLDVAVSFAGGPELFDRDCASATVEAYRRHRGPDVSLRNAAPVLVEEGFR